MIINILVLAAVVISTSDAFYVPGIAPHEFSRGSKIGKYATRIEMWQGLKNFHDFFFEFPEVKAVKMTSTRTQLPYEYYSLQFCLPKNGTLHYKSENLGEVLRGKFGLKYR